MDRTFHAHVHFTMYILITILAIGACMAFWYRMAVYGAAMLLFLTVVIERIIHTTYTITGENKLIVCYGRFMRKRTIPVKAVRRIEKCRHIRLCGHCLLSYLLIVYDNEKYIPVMPVNEDDFLKVLTKSRQEAGSRKSVIP